MEAFSPLRRFLVIALTACLLVLALFGERISVEAKKSKATLYDVLAVPDDASASELKKTFHKAALKFHPDKNPNHKEPEKLEKKFTELSRAYDILSDTDKRAYYDSRLEEGIVEWNEEAYQAEVARREAEQKAKTQRLAQQRANAAEQRIESLEERLEGRKPEPEQSEGPSDAARRRDELILSYLPFLKPFDMKTRSIIARVISGAILVLGLLVAWASLRQTRLYQQLFAPARVDARTAAKTEAQARQTEQKLIEEDAVKREAERREKRRLMIIKALEEKNKEIPKTDEEMEEIYTVLSKEEFAQSIQHTAVTKFDNDEEVQLQLELQLQKEIEEAQKPNKAKKNRCGEGKKAAAKARAAEATAEADDDEEKPWKQKTTAESATQGNDFECTTCKVGFKTEAQLTNHAKSKKHLKALKDNKRVEKQQAKEAAAKARGDLGEPATVPTKGKQTNKRKNTKKCDNSSDEDYERVKELKKKAELSDDESAPESTPANKFAALMD